MAKSKKTLYKLLIGGAVLLVVLGITIGSLHARKAHHLKVEERNRDSIAKAGPIVKAYRAKNSAGRLLLLIGEARSYETATLYAQISGYLQNILVDKGDKVVENQVLAYVDNPQIDQQIAAAQSDLVNKTRIRDRDKELLKNQFVSQEQYDLSETNVETAAATLTSLQEEEAYKVIKAPFTGTITDRYVDPGAMIQSAVGSQSGSQPIVSIATLERLRIYVYVEQKDAGFLKNGYPATMTVNEHPDDTIRGFITRFAGQLDPHTRMMLVEIDVDNHHNEIVPGSYVTVHIKGPKDKASTIQIPSNGLVVHKDKTMVAIIDKDTTLRFQAVTIGQNNGDSVTLLNGVQEGQLIAIQVGENFIEGQKVRIQSDSTAKGGGGPNQNGQNQSDSTGQKKSKDKKNNNDPNEKLKKMEKKNEQ